MSRIGRLPVTIPESVKVDINGSEVRVKGPKGELVRTVSCRRWASSWKTTRSWSPEFGCTCPMRALHGTTRALLQNMVTGVSTGFTTELEVDGVGYRVEMDGNKLVLVRGIFSSFHHRSTCWCFL